MTWNLDLRLFDAEGRSSKHILTNGGLMVIYHGTIILNPSVIFSSGLMFCFFASGFFQICNGGQVQNRETKTLESNSKSSFTNVNSFC